MPIYEYRCDSCHDEFEVTQRITDAPLRACPKCEGPVEKLISQSSFVLKGSGWYATDYGSKTGRGPEKAAKPDSAPSCAAGGSKPACASCASSSA
ncbi:MAG: FmdB family zinc ribbon protein [Deferrisomatales bacterium]